MRRIVLLLLLTCSAIAVVAQNVAVHCDAGQSLNATISRLPKKGPATVTVHGTCTEYVLIAGFENLTVKGISGATLVQPSEIPANINFALLQISASHSVTIDGLNFSSDASKPSVIGIGEGSNDVRLRNLNIVGGNPGIIMGEGSQVSIARVNIRNFGYAALGVYSKALTTVEDCVFEDSTGTGWHTGIDDDSGYIGIHRTTIRNMSVGANIHGGGSIAISKFNTYYPDTNVSDVVIDNPAGLNYEGFVIDGNSSLNVYAAKLRILNAGQTWGGNSAAIWLSGGSSLNASAANLIISGSQGQGIYLTGNSTATLHSSTITGSLHGGVVALNQSQVSVVLGDPATTVTGNAVDVFCDSKSLITGGSNINASTIQCPNLLPGDTVPIP